jgi:DNA-binding winged helix-turn-helix (wHTH) protein
LLPLGPEPPHGIKVDWAARHLTVNGKTVRLTPMEWSIVERLAWSPGQLVTHRQLFKHLYGTDRDCRAQSTAVRVRISKLRQKLPLTIEARWGQGYVLEGVGASRSSCRDAEPRLSAEAEPQRQPSSKGPPLAPRPARDFLRQSTGREFATLAIAPSARENRTASRPSQSLRASEPMLRSEALAAAAPVAGRNEELGIIERFLAERGVTKCPNAGAMQLAPLPALVWDKTKRKWVRPTADACATRDPT